MADIETDQRDPGDQTSARNKLKYTKRRYQCDECEHSSNDKKNLKKHCIRKHTGNMPYKCEYTGCNVSTLTPGALREHKRVHANEMEYECDLCDYRCNLKGTLYNHKKNKHLFTDEVLQERSQMYKCSQCDYASASRSKVKDHKLTHLSADDRPLKCLQCSYTANRQYQLDAHMTSKHDEKKKSLKPVLTCDKCDFTAVTKNTIDKHVVRCTGNHPYTCTKCDYKTAVLKNLYSHAETHTN
jgi:KRAB domain-containing zinc finger protein